MHNTAVTCLVSSRKGLVWTASAAGSVRQIGVDGARNAVEAKAPNCKSAHSTAISAAVVTNVDTLWTGARNVRVWTHLGEWRQSLQTHAGKVLSMAVAGDCVWVGFSDGRLRLFEQDSAVCVVQLQDDGKHSPITCLSPTAHAMWTGTADGHVCCFGIESRRQLLEAPVFSKSAVSALAPTARTVWIAGEKGAILALPRPDEAGGGGGGGVSLLRESSAEIDQWLSRPLSERSVSICRSSSSDSLGSTNSSSVSTVSTAAKGHSNRILALLAVPAGEPGGAEEGRGGVVLWSAAKSDRTALVWGPLPGDDIPKLPCASLGAAGRAPEELEGGQGGIAGMGGMSIRSEENSDEEEYSLAEPGMPSVDVLSRVWTWSDHQQVITKQTQTRTQTQIRRPPPPP